MRVISMQSPDVLKILLRDRIYHANLNLCRERASYAEDIKNLNGLVPIWCWAYPDLSFRTLFNGEVLEYLRCEMSLQQENCWDPFVMLEIEIPERSLKRGQHHNDCPYSKVFGELTIEMLRAMYKLMDSDNDGWYFKVITPMWVKDKTDCITPDVLDCYYWDKHEDLAPSKYFDVRDLGKCLKCGRETKNTYKSKHLCSLKCMFKEQQQFLQSCSIRGMNPNSAIELYNSLTDTDLECGIHEYVKRHITVSK